MKEQAGSLATFTTSLLLHHSNIFRKVPLCIIGFTNRDSFKSLIKSIGQNNLQRILTLNFKSGIKSCHC